MKAPVERRGFSFIYELDKKDLVPYCFLYRKKRKDSKVKTMKYKTRLKAELKALEINEETGFTDFAWVVKVDDLYVVKTHYTK